VPQKYGFDKSNLYNKYEHPKSVTIHELPLQKREKTDRQGFFNSIDFNNNYRILKQFWVWKKETGNIQDKKRRSCILTNTSTPSLKYFLRPQYYLLIR